MKYNRPNDSEPMMVNEPGVYTDEEFEEVIRQSMASGTISNEEALARFAKWGFVL